MTQLEVGKKYSTKELQTTLGITKDQWKKKKNEYLKNIGMAYQYEVEYKGRSVIYCITEKIGDYKKPERKNARLKTDEVIKEFINEVLEEDPLQTAANINRRAWENSDTHPSSVVLLGLKNSTTGEYIRLNLREMYGTQVDQGGTVGMIEKKIWCYLDNDNNCYVEMKPEMVQKFFKCFDEVRENKKDFELTVCADYENGLITKEEMNEMLGDNTFNLYRDAKRLFCDKYGYFPIKVPLYVKNAWKRDDLAYIIKE